MIIRQNGSLFFNYYLERHGGNLVFSSNLKRQDVPLLNLTDPFLTEIVEYWSTFKLQGREPRLLFHPDLA